MTLFLVPTPIGNLKDITLRAIEVLKSVPIVLSEDTRVTRKLFDLLEIDSSKKRFVQFYDHNEERLISKVLDALTNNVDIALVSDAGTPLLSDPGFKLIRKIRQKHYKEINIEVLPGATSITTALVSSGLPPDKFMFIGYIPRKQNGRKLIFESLKKSNKIIKCSYIAFETHYRLIKTLESIKENLGSKTQIALCQELTKRHERVQMGTVNEIITAVNSMGFSFKGEITIVIAL